MGRTRATSNVPDAPDLAALLSRLVPDLMTMEEPLLEDAGLSMWEYAILSELVRDPGQSQIELSRRTRRDPTRLGRHLDALSARGLVERERAPDQRQRSATVTSAGIAVHTRLKRRIRSAEDAYLNAELSATDAARLRRLLEKLSTRVGNP